MSETTSKPWPTTKYRLLNKAYMPRVPGGEDEFLDPERLPAGVTEIVVVYDGRPGPHMQPMDAAGEEALKRAGNQTLAPINQLSLIVGEETSHAATIERLKNELTMALLRQAAPPDAVQVAPVYVPPVPTAAVQAPPLPQPPVYKVPPPPPAPRN